MFLRSSGDWGHKFVDQWSTVSLPFSSQNLDGKWGLFDIPRLLSILNVCYEHCYSFSYDFIEQIGKKSVISLTISQTVEQKQIKGKLTFYFIYHCLRSIPFLYSIID